MRPCGIQWIDLRGTVLYSTHSLRANAATLLLAAGVDLRKVQELPGHRHVTTTQICDKRQRTTTGHQDQKLKLQIGTSSEALSLEPRPFLDRSRQLFHVACNDPIHAGLAHGLLAEFIALRRGPGPEERAGLESSLFEVFGNRLGGGEMDADGVVLVALLVDGQRGLLTVLVKVLDPQPAGGGEPDAGAEVSFEDGAVTEIEHVIAGGKTHQLTGSSGSQRSCALEWIGRFPGR
jgi:hypothetical protein